MSNWNQQDKAAFNIEYTSPGSRRPEVPASVDQLHGATEQLAGVVAELIGRLSPVLSPEAGASGNQACPTSTCALAGELQLAIDRVRLIEGRVVNLLHRLEI